MQPVYFGGAATPLSECLSVCQEQLLLMIDNVYSIELISSSSRAVDFHAVLHRLFCWKFLRHPHQLIKVLQWNIYYELFAMSSVRHASLLLALVRSYNFWHICLMTSGYQSLLQQSKLAVIDSSFSAMCFCWLQIWQIRFVGAVRFGWCENLFQKCLFLLPDLTCYVVSDVVRHAWAQLSNILDVNTCSQWFASSNAGS